MNETKRRLRLMPEILPTPQRIATGPSARGRVMNRLKVLGALTTVGIAAACGKTENDGTGSSSGGSSGNPFLDAGPVEAGEDAYGVVDPLPRPTCFNPQDGTIPGKLVAEGHYDDGADAGADAGVVDAGSAKRFEVTVTFEKPIQGLVLGATETDGSIEVVSTDITTTTVRLVGRLVDAPPLSESVRISLSCSTGPTTLQLQLDFRETSIEAKVYAY